MEEMIIAGFFVFVMRLTDMSLDTIRLLFTMRGRKWLSGLIGAAQATVFILAVSKVLSGPLNPFTVIGYSAGFGAGIVVGMFVEERLAIGHAIVRVYSPLCGKVIAEALRAAGHAATEFPAQGKDGRINVVNCVVARRDISAVRAIIVEADSNAFITIDEARPVQRGYFRR